MKYLLLIILGLSCIQPVEAQTDFCSIRNSSFNAGESITLKVFYNLGKMYVGAGEATFNVALERFANRDVYHVVGDGKTYRAYDWIFKVRDRYESYIDTATLQPLKFIRNVNEGGYKIFNNVVFNQAGHQAISTNGTFTVPPCVQDVISAIYYARNIDFNKYNTGDKIPFAMFLDDQVYNIYIRYMGKEEVNTKFGKFRAIKFKPLLIKGTIFEGGEKMTVWVSDDANKVPLRIESPISVGNIIVDMINYTNLRYPFTSLLNKK
ncbi:Protein of unknown function [Chitinophaga ginsengisegetis]|uniref:DUF3108 domain-containing protein n=1 Tax=Chitinophaga ginsengisegetis TaxID=393003 RepID=A0A1T5PCA8_9BACT|nr:DUF3108 domain-containing protein [Chitinophaga ginsengisegetis]SKD10375.1 Protein of unknown function [Chitinophaga ginsengisegetis]